MSFDERLTTRSSSVLSAMIASLGNESAVLRALVIIGLHTCGKDIQLFTADALASVARLDDHVVRDTLLAVLMKPVEHALHSRSPSVDHGLNRSAPVVDHGLNRGTPPVEQTPVPLPDSLDLPPDPEYQDV
ncbi:hypothetical protein [Herpetosiphon geysericola]|uniref:Uncharacterized protein n=1 Tax=Herpetosiphon geysericola TaxID=70996 RepID=A0A0P6XJH3_9CHLR|nr:hypothetical protein [Herpetosiphon geysericola]KPL80287.1 hypothetical protein SE18_24880 [Herpetosiphon geysericola]